MRAALYIRVSTDEQAREGFSIPAQAKALREYCEKNSIKIYDEFVDEGISGAKENRPQFQRMIKEGLQGKYNIILVHKFDRFARKVELSQRIKNQLKKANINVVSITEPLEDSPMGFFVGGLHDLLAEYYIKNLSQEVKKGQKEKVAQGYAVNRMCYGYKNKNGTVEIVEEQAKIVRLVFDMYSAGNGSTIIANFLNSHSIPTKERGIWNSSQINYMLKNATYTGTLKWGGKIYPETFPGIIAIDLFNKTQELIKPSKGLKRKEYYNKFLLLGLLKCGYCGAVMRISKMTSNGGKGSKVYYMYTCAKARYDKKACDFSKHFDYIDVDKEVINYIKDVLKGLVSDYTVYTSSSVQDLLAERKDRILAELERAKRAYLGEIFSLEEYSIEKNRLETELKLLDLGQEKGKKISQNSWDKHKNMLDEFRNESSIQGKKAKLQEIVREIKIFKDCMSVELYG